MVAGLAVTPGCLGLGWWICHFCLRVTVFRVGAVTGRGEGRDGGRGRGAGADRARVEVLRAGLGVRLATYRTGKSLRGS
jgi:hypothetical protein